MEIINFIKTLSVKSKNYQIVWLIVLSKVSINEDSSFSIFEIVAKTKIPIKTIYVILNFGFEYFNKISYNYQFGLKNNTIYIYQINNKNKYDFIVKKIRKSKKTEKVTVLPITRKTSIIKDKKTEKHSSNSEIIKIIINKLNQSTNKFFLPTSKSTIKVINERIEEGFTIDQFFYVIESKTAQWKDSSENNLYLRPSTLFGEKMESYINEKQIYLEKESSKSKLEIGYGNISIAKAERNRNSSKH